MIIRVNVQICVMIAALAAVLATMQPVNSAGKPPVFLRPGQTLPPSSDAQRVLVIFHGMKLAGTDMTDDANSAYSTGYFDRVVAPTYSYPDESISSFAPKIFAQLETAYPNAQFVLQGYSKGGLVAEWIAERVPEADGRIERVITIDSPLNGASAAKYFPDKLPGWQELEPGSMALAALHKEPINDMSTVDFVQLYAAGDDIVAEQSAFRDLSSQYGTIRRIRLQGVIHPQRRLNDPLNVHSLMRSYLSQHADLYARILDGDLDPAASTGIWTIQDEECIRVGRACVKACDSIKNGSWWSDCVLKCANQYPCIVRP